MPYYANFPIATISSAVANVNPNSNRSGSVSPLLQTTWHQGDAYYLPPNAPTGCVAVAMAQVMKYWSYPTTGTGSHSYYRAPYGWLSANFGATTYNWQNMPNISNATNRDLALAMYHIGVSVDMQYGYGLVMKYPRADLTNSLKFVEGEMDAFFEVLKNSIESVYDAESVYRLADSTPEEVDEFIQSLDTKAFKKIQDFFSTMPKLYYEVKYTNSLGNEKLIPLTSLTDFFTLG